MINTFCYILSIVLYIVGGLCVLFVISNDSCCESLKQCIILLILAVIFIGLGKICWNQGLAQDQKKCDNYNNTIYTQQIHSKQYKEQLGIVENISSNKIEIKDTSEGYYLNKDSLIKNFNNFKPGDKVDISYIVNGYDCNIIMSIKKVN